MQHVVFHKLGAIVLWLFDVDEAVHTIAIPNMYMDMRIALLVYVIEEVVVNKPRVPCMSLL